jgi:hypothetical protein
MVVEWNNLRLTAHSTQSEPFRRHSWRFLSGHRQTIKPRIGGVRGTIRHHRRQPWRLDHCQRAILV